jgi:hypothetical protein
LKDVKRAAVLALRNGVDRFLVLRDGLSGLLRMRNLGAQSLILRDTYSA